jgi:hypothetical protein
MGGPGSTRWRRHRKARTVEQTRTFNLDHFLRGGNFPAAGSSGKVRWLNGFTANYDFLPGAVGGLVLALGYHRVTLFGREAISLPIRLKTTPTPTGKARWWATCPVMLNGVLCGRRVLHLYLPDRARLFGCRTCHHLTYTSCQYSHRQGFAGTVFEFAKVMGVPKLKRDRNRINPYPED